MHKEYNTVNTGMDYEEAIAYMQNLTKFGFNFGLGRITELLNRLEKPQQSLKIVHVGGTNGKGSTASMLAAILQQNFKVGMFSSPHLHAYTERYRVNGVQITEERIAQLISGIKPHLEAMVEEGFEHPTEFEVSTALCFQYFFEEQVDLLILEVGLGGAIDSTNVIEDALISVITNVGMDHMDYLGNSVTEIAKVKAGIIKEKGTVVTASNRAEVVEIIQSVCSEKQAKLKVVGKDTKWDSSVGNMEGNRFNYQGLKLDYRDVFIPLLGEHQIINCVTALTVLELLLEKGFKVSEEAIRQGLRNCRWPARLEIMQRSPLVVIDGAHNLDGAIQLKQALKNNFKYKKLILVIGMLGDKEREKVAQELAVIADKVIVTKPNNPRAEVWQTMADEVRKYVPEVYLEEDIHRAVKLGLELAGTEDMVCITGSLYMVASAREFWTQHA